MNPLLKTQANEGDSRDTRINSTPMDSGVLNGRDITFTVDLPSNVATTKTKTDSVWQSTNGEVILASRKQITILDAKTRQVKQQFAVPKELMPRFHDDPFCLVEQIADHLVAYLTTHDVIVYDFIADTLELAGIPLGHCSHAIAMAYLAPGKLAVAFEIATPHPGTYLTIGSKEIRHGVLIFDFHQVPGKRMVKKFEGPLVAGRTFLDSQYGAELHCDTKTINLKITPKDNLPSQNYVWNLTDNK